MASKFTQLFRDFFNSEKIGGLLLLICTVISMFIANSNIGDGYLAVIHHKIDLSFSSIPLNYSVEHWVNDGLMAIFFLMIGLEVEREIYVGELSNVKKAILPIAAAIGGVCIPSLIHFSLNAGTSTQPGFAIPMATDIAFALGILSLAGKKVPAAVKVFLAALAIVDDLFAVIVIAIFYTKTILFTYLAMGLGILIVLFIFNRLRIRNLFFYLLPGIVIWYCFLKSGVHATIAGVLLAFVIPFHERDENNISYRLQHFLHKPVAFVIIPIFALVNTAIVLPADIKDSLTTTNALGIILGLLAGKLIGIFSFPFLLIKMGLAKLQSGVTWRKLAGIGCLGGIGFTMSMFITNLAFTDPATITSSKVGILFASGCSAIIGLIVFLTSPTVKQQEV